MRKMTRWYQAAIPTVIGMVFSQPRKVGDKKMRCSSPRRFLHCDISNGDRVINCVDTTIHKASTRCIQLPPSLMTLDGSSEHCTGYYHRHQHITVVWLTISSRARPSPNLLTCTSYVCLASRTNNERVNEVRKTTQEAVKRDSSHMKELRS